MTVNLSDPIFHEEEAARAHMEAIRWPNGPFCPHCGSVENITRLQGQSHRPGLHQCNACRGHFTVTNGSVMERSHVPLHKWVLAFHLMAASKKGMSAHQLARMLDVTYKTAWFMAHRIREAMTNKNPPPLGGEGKVVEADETYHGTRETPVERSRNARKVYLKGGKSAQKRPIVGLVERGGEARAYFVPRVTAKNVRDALVKNADRKSRLHTDESNLYPEVGREFAKHETVRHSAKEYARDDVNTNSVEGFFGIFKRGMTGVYHHCGEQHLQRYLNEFSFRYSNRSKLGVEDAERAVRAIRGAEGKRLTYQGTASA
ncbi:MAG TPA: IS1595 family transposase [Acetobacteraceae bacterium]|nr:IS1595 family transposase [Acetobacteraceae bacterium]